MTNIVDAAIEYIKELFSGNAGGHDASHTLRVYHNAVHIAEKENACNMSVVALAALLHDADDHKLFRTDNNANARKFLLRQNLEEETINQIIAAINSVSFSKNRGKKPESLEGMIVQDADRLDAIGAIGIARTFAFGGEHGRTLDASIQHFHDKLLLLKNEMNTETAKKMAEDRHRFMEQYLIEYQKETGMNSQVR